MMPKGYYVTCHGAFGDLAEEYKQYAARTEAFNEKVVNLDGYLSTCTLPYLLTEEEYEKFNQNQVCIHGEKNSCLGSFALLSVILLAKNGQIDKKYEDPIEALKAVNFLRLSIVFCLYNNQAVYNSICVSPIDDYKLFLNGALEYLIC